MICVFALLVLAAIPVAPVAASADGDPIVVDANATPSIKLVAPHFTNIQDGVDAAGAGATNSGLPAGAVIMAAPAPSPIYGVGHRHALQRHRQIDGNLFGIGTR
jgi:hypothetical protein